DSARSNNWGSTIGTDTVTGTGSGLTQTLTVYGQIAAAQTPLAGAYSDTVTVTLTY
ncbi:spore coat protein U domain-containing protein, partial [Acinetobacter baumannii]